jgi:decaprenylphospho-beta-D-erythro-pentofuranosid-2-ulose 2-reductase
MPTALVLGATSDMAVAMARQFASQGYAVQLAARQPEHLAALASDLHIRYGVSATSYAFDAGDFASHSRFYDALTPKPDVTICVFGYMADEAVAAKDWDVAWRMIHTNYVGAVSILQVIAQEYAQRQAGIIVGISSVAGDRGRASKLIYGSSKAGFSAYLSGLRNKLATAGVHVLSVKPGFVYTRMTEGMTLPPLLTATPEQVALAVYHAVVRRKNTLYVKWMWRWIMLVIRLIPEPFFKKLHL